MRDLTVAAAFAGAVGAVTAWPASRAALARPPERLFRTNVSGKRVPAVLGHPVVIGGVTSIVAAAWLSPLLVWPEVQPDRWGGAALIVLLVMATAGAWDDGRGDERPRGFAGHLGAARGGRMTGGIVKVLAAGGGGAVAGFVLYGWDKPAIVLTVAAVGLGANLVNLLDRAPGRAGKFTLAAGVPLAAFGSFEWGIAAAGTLVALTVVLPADLGERGMLGDAGANPLGALLGLGLVASFDGPALAAAVVVLLALNLASERWSFSKVIERTPPLRWLDAIGRK
ncbi:MAG: hypothetical protein M3323_15485 [Actinomycetota bacterium]|nr:hypothetical protein [Actinomycetota bacterium]